MQGRNNVNWGVCTRDIMWAREGAKGYMMVHEAPCRLGRGSQACVRGTMRAEKDAQGSMRDAIWVREGCRDAQ